MKDSKIFNLIEKEKIRQKNNLELIPSENYSSQEIRKVLGSVLTDKYAEGYPFKRYYAGLKYYDKLETICQERAKKLFKVEHVNVQPYSGSPANLAVCFGLLSPGDKLMGMHLSHGGHLTHGWKVNFSAKYYQSVQYQVDEKTHLIDYNQLAKQVLKEKPKLIWAGATAYPRIFNWKKFKEIADSVSAYLVTDISHIAGLIVAGAHSSPVNYAHVITSTTHKTLRGPRGGMIMITKQGIKKDPDICSKIDKAVFPGLQGGPHENQIAAIAVCLKEADSAAFKKYGKQIVKNSQKLANELIKRDFNLITGGTDNHLILIDLRNKNISGKQAQINLEKSGIVVNKNTIPYDSASPFNPSGIRIGTPALTTRGMKEKEMVQVADFIQEGLFKNCQKKVEKFCQKFPLP